MSRDKKYFFLKIKTSPPNKFFKTQTTSTLYYNLDSELHRLYNYSLYFDKYLKT